MISLFKSLTTIQKFFAIFGPILLLLGTHMSAYYVGYNKGKAISDLEIQKYENKILILNSKVNEKQVEIQTKVITEYVDRVRKVDRIVYRNIEIVKEVPSVGHLTKGWVYLHNQTVLQKEADPNLAADPEISKIKDTDALDIILKNYKICLQDKADLQAWKDWYLNSQEILETDK